MHIALRRIELGLREKDALGEVGTAQVSASEVGPDEVGHSQVGASEVSSDQRCPSQVGTSEVGSSEVFPDKVGAAVVDRPSGLGSHEFACASQ